MKIVTKGHFGEDIHAEKVVAENVTEDFGKEMVEVWNTKHWISGSPYFLALEDDNYKPTVGKEKNKGG